MAYSSANRLNKNRIIISNWDKLPIVMDMKTVALVLDVTEETVRHMIYHGDLKAVKVGAQWRFDKDYLREFVRSGKFLTKEGAEPSKRMNSTI